MPSPVRHPCTARVALVSLYKVAHFIHIDNQGMVTDAFSDLFLCLTVDLSEAATGGNILVICKSGSL